MVCIPRYCNDGGKSSREKSKELLGNLEANADALSFFSFPARADFVFVGKNWRIVASAGRARDGVKTPKS
jgi:hypothetical protein